MKRRMKFCLIFLALVKVQMAIGQEKNVSDFLTFASMEIKEREYRLLTKWNITGFEEGFSESGDSFWRELKYKGAVSLNEKYELCIGSVIEMLNEDNTDIIETNASYYFRLKLNSDAELTKWKQEVIDLGVVLDKIEEFDEVKWMAHLYSPLCKFKRISLAREAVGNSYEYWIQVD